jgi:hypothetical protein
LVIVVQIFGFIALAWWVSSIQLRQKSGILLCQMLASVFYFLHYALLNAPSAAAVSVVSIVRLISIYLIERKGRNVQVYVLVLFIILLLGVGFLTYDGPLSTFPIIITILYTYGTWQPNTRILRLIFFVCAWMWIYFNYNVGSYILIVGNAMEIISSVVSFFRFGLLKKRTKAQGKA